MDAKQLGSLVRYDAQSGELTWRQRPLDAFDNAQAGRTWNTRYSGQPAFATKTKGGYLRGEILIAGRRCSLLAHRVAWAIYSGRWPECDVDHINGERSDNRIANLRLSTAIGNNNRNRKMQKNNTSGATGLRFHGGGWSVACGKYWGREVCLGRAISILSDLRGENRYTNRHGRVEQAA